MTATEEDVSKREYRRVHRLTPLLEFWQGLLAVLVVFAFNLNASALSAIGAFLTGEGEWVPVLYGVGAFAVFCGLVWLASYAWWRATGYVLDEEEIAFKKGVLARQERTARYDRIQAVDVVEPLVARLFRVAAVRVETAGGTGSVIEIAFLTRPDAANLRAEVLAHTRADPGTGAVEGAPDEAGDIVVEEIPIARSLAGAALNFGAILAVAGLVFIIVSPLGWVTAVPLMVGALPPVFRLVDRSWRFRAQLVDDHSTLDLNYGLASRRRQTIPLDRIHGVQVVQPILWRLTGWWLVKVSIAGYGAITESDSGTTTLLPVGKRQQALAVAALVGPLDTEDIENHARPEGAPTPTFTSPKRAWWVSPVDRDQQAVTLLNDVAICHHGRFSRVVSFIDFSHIQELSLVRGPVQHLFKLSSVRLDLVLGPVRMTGRDLAVDDGYALLDRLRQRSLPALQQGVEVDHGIFPSDINQHRRPAAGPGRGGAADGDR